MLRWPRGTDTQALEQAQRNAKTLALWLSSATGEPVKVRPLLVLPGWWVERKGRGPVNVLNEKEVQRSFTNERTIEEAQLRRIVHQLREHCRLEFERQVAETKSAKRSTRWTRRKQTAAGGKRVRMMKIEG